MRLRKHKLLLTGFIVCLAFDAWVYGSLSREPGVGTALATAAAANAPLLHTYIVLGAPIAAELGASGGQAVADAAFGDAYPSILAVPEAADSLLFSQSRGQLRHLMVVLYWAAPVLLVLSLAAWFLRSRTVHLVGRAKR